jgi:uncharacterized protein with PQ loop repeat
MPPTISTIAGFIASAIFIISAFPSLAKVYRTRCVDSYSLLALWMLNLGNVRQWLYVLGLPLRPICALHSWSTLSTALLLIWRHRYRRPDSHDSPERLPRRLQPLPGSTRPLRGCE